MPGYFSNGKTAEEAKRNIRDAIRLHIESLLADGQPVPQNEKLVLIEEVIIGVP